MATERQTITNQKGVIVTTIEALPEKFRVFITENIEIWSLGIGLAFYYSAIRVFITQITGKLTDVFPIWVLGLIGSLLFISPLFALFLEKSRTMRLVIPLFIAVAKLGQALPFFAFRMGFNTVLLLLTSTWITYYLHYMFQTLEKKDLLLALGSSVIIDLSLRAPILGVDSGLTTNLFVLAMVLVLSGLFVLGSHVLTITENEALEKEGSEKGGILQGTMFAMLVTIFLFEVGNAGEIALMFSVEPFVIHLVLLFSHIFMLIVAVYVLEIFTERQWRLLIVALLFFSGVVLLESIILRPWRLWITYPSPFLAILAFWLFYSRGFLSRKYIVFSRFVAGIVLGFLFVLIYTMVFLLFDSLIVEITPALILLGTAIWTVMGGDE